MAGPLLFLVGPTASGKKKAALEVAAALDAELLSLDSMKVYRGMDLGTDKGEVARFALTDLAEPAERFSVGAYVRAAQEATALIRARGHRPLFVGGTGLYLRALVRGLFDGPDIPPEIRNRVAERGAAAEAAGQPGREELHRELAAVDPQSAARLHVHDRKRIVRALEVWHATGRSLSQWQADTTRRPIEGTPILVGIRWSRAALHRRIAERVERMFADGLIDEVRRLSATRSIGPVAGLAIGYREVVDHLAGGRSLADCKAAVVHGTTAFLRRQENWFRQFPEIRWVAAEPEPALLPTRIEQAFRSALAGEVA